MLKLKKKPFAATWACERFQQYLLGMHFKLETDHKPLVPLLSTKSLDKMPIRVQCFRLCLMRFGYSIYHVPGKDICTVDTLSRAPVLTEDHTAEAFHKEVNAYVNLAIDHLPAPTKWLQEIICLQEQDETCQKLKLYHQNWWPAKKYLSGISLPLLTLSSF